MKTAATCTAILGLLLFGLGFYVSALRGRKQQIGTAPQDPTDPLFKAIRAHANTAEYAPMLAILMLYLGAHSPNALVLWTMVIVTACRLLIAVGILMSASLDRPQPLRFVGALGTYLGGILLGIVALVAT